MPRVIVVPQVTTFTAITKLNEAFSPVFSELSETPLLSKVDPDHDVELQKLYDERARLYAERKQSFMFDVDEKLDRLHEEEMRYLSSKIEEREGTTQYWGLRVPSLGTKVVKIDPMIDELRWRLSDRRKVDSLASAWLSDNIIAMSDATLESRLWKIREEIEAWVAGYATDDLLIQRNSGGWNFVPLNQRDASAFREWLLQPKEHLVILPQPKKWWSLVSSWCNENMHGDWMPIHNNSESELRLMIRRDDDAVMCKLRWSEPQSEDE